MMLKMENLPLLHQFLPTFWCDRFDKMVEKVAGSAVFHSFSFFLVGFFLKRVCTSSSISLLCLLASLFCWPTPLLYRLTQ